MNINDVQAMSLNRVTVNRHSSTYNATAMESKQGNWTYAAYSSGLVGRIRINMKEN